MVNRIKDGGFKKGEISVIAAGSGGRSAVEKEFTLGQIAAPMPSTRTHVDEWLDNPQWPKTEAERYARFFLEFFRMPAWKKSMYQEFVNKPVFCTYNGERFRCIGASRMGDIWLTRNFDKQFGYDLRIYVDQVSDWSMTP